MSKSFYDWNVQKFTWHEEDGLYVIDNDFTINFRDELHRKYSFIILKGAKTDGGSIPKIFSWFADSWRDDAGARIRVGVVVLNFEFHALSVFDALLSSFVSSSLTVRSTGLATNSSVSAKSHTCCTFST